MALGTAALYAAVMARWYPYRGVFAFDPDEGINAMKALLVARGHPLYAQTWSDQPPLFTHLLRLWLDALGWDVDSGRMLVLLLAAASVFALYDSVRSIAGHLAAVASTFLLATSAYFPRLSVSLMLAVPSLALGLLALWALIRWQCGGRQAWLATAGVLMGCALTCKLTAAILVPPFAAWLVAFGPRQASGAPAWRATTEWLLVTLVTAAVLLLLLVGPTQLSALVDTHIAARQTPRLTRYGWLGLAATGLAEWPLTLLGVGGCVLIVSRRLRLATVFPLWAATAAIALLGHAPVWYHHQLLLSLPFCAAGGIAAAEIFRRRTGAARLPDRGLLTLRIATGGLLAVLPVWSALAPQRPAVTPLAGAPERVLAAMRQLAPMTRVVVASNPMYAFRAGYMVPPALSALPLKRVATEPHIADDVRAAFTQFQPEQVLLAPGAVPELAEWFRAAMAERYRLLLAESGTELFIRSDLPAGELGVRAADGRAGDERGDVDR